MSVEFISIIALLVLLMMAVLVDGKGRTSLDRQLNVLKTDHAAQIKRLQERVHALESKPKAAPARSPGRPKKT